MQNGTRTISVLGAHASLPAALGCALMLAGGCGGTTPRTQAERDRDRAAYEDQSRRACDEMLMANAAAPVPGPEIEGGLAESGLDERACAEESEGIRRVITNAISSVRWCYEAALEHVPDLRGRVVMRFLIEPDGDVRRVEIDANHLGIAGPACCIGRVLQGLRFPPPVGGRFAVVNYPFSFSPAE
jgi:hypothetical protein